MLNIIIFIVLCIVIFILINEVYKLLQKLKTARNEHTVLYQKLCNEVSENSMLKAELLRKNEEIQSRNMYISSLKYQLMTRTSSSSIYSSDDIKDAVKFAMIHSHPDNGGTQEDFIKYRKLYKNISGGNV